MGLFRLYYPSKHCNSLHKLKNLKQDDFLVFWNSGYISLSKRNIPFRNLWSQPSFKTWSENTGFEFVFVLLWSIICLSSNLLVMVGISSLYGTSVHSQSMIQLKYGLNMHVWIICVVASLICLWGGVSLSIHLYWESKKIWVILR